MPRFILPLDEVPSALTLLAGRGRGLLPGHARRGSAVVDFAVIAPLLTIVIIGSFDTSLAYIVSHQVQDTAQQIAIGATTVAAGGGGDTSALTTTQAQQLLSMIFAGVPLLRNGSLKTTAYSATLTGVVYTASPSGCVDPNCSYAANVTWSTALTLGSADSTKLRACGTLSEVSNTATTDYTNLPTAAFAASTKSNSSNFIVADVSVKYTPMFTKFITGPVTFFSSAYGAARGTSSDFIRYDTANAATNSQVCTGYKS